MRWPALTLVFATSFVGACSSAEADHVRSTSAYVYEPTNLDQAPMILEISVADDLSALCVEAECGANAMALRRLEILRGTQGAERLIVPYLADQAGQNFLQRFFHMVGPGPHTVLIVVQGIEMLGAQIPAYSIPALWNSGHDGAVPTDNMYSVGLIFHARDGREYIIPALDMIGHVRRFTSFEPESQNDAGQTLRDILEFQVSSDFRKLASTARQEITDSNDRIGL